MVIQSENERADIFVGVVSFHDVCRHLYPKIHYEATVNLKAMKFLREGKRYSDKWIYPIYINSNLEEQMRLILSYLMIASCLEELRWIAFPNPFAVILGHISGKFEKWTNLVELAKIGLTKHNYLQAWCQGLAVKKFPWFDKNVQSLPRPYATNP